MDEEIFALLTGDEPTAQEKAAALAASLRRQRGMGVLGVLSGDPTLTRVGQAQLAAAGQGREAIAEAGKAQLGLRRSLEAQRAAMAAEAAKNEREKAEEAARWERDRMYQDKARGETLANQLTAARIARGEAAAAKAEAALSDDVKELAKRVPPEATSMIQAVDDLESQVAGLKSIPGVGPVQGRLPAFALSPQGQAIRQRAKDVVSQKIKLTSGTAASDTEVERIMEVLGMGPSATDEMFRRGLKNLRADVVADLAQRVSGFSPAAVEEYTKRGGLTPEKAAKPPGPAKGQPFFDPVKKKWMVPQ